MKQSEKDAIIEKITNKINRYRKELQTIPGTDDYRSKRFYCYGIINTCNSMLEILKKH